MIRRRGGRRLPAAVAVVLVVAALGAALTAPWSDAAHGATDAAPDATVRRVLVVSLPDVDWSDVAGADFPHLERLFEGSAIGGLVTNGALRPSNLGASYVAMGAGARAVAAPATSGQGFGVDESFGVDPAGVVFRARTGAPSGDGLVYLPLADVVAENDEELYGAEVGLLGSELARHDVERAVIANGDGSDPSTPERSVPPYRRAAVAALMTGEGRVPGGQVDRDLLTDDPTAPFGLRLDSDAVVTRFDEVFTNRSVVLVEGSDLVRAELASGFASPEQAERMTARALRDTDRLVGRLLERVDPARDAVLVVGPEPPDDEHGLTIAAVRAPGFDPGLLVSTTTSRAGFVNMLDVAPTILHLLGIDRPGAMEGRRMHSEEGPDALASRVRWLVDTNEDGLFRDSQVGVAMTVVVVVAAALALATAFARRRWPRIRGLLAFGALGVVGLLDATYLASPLHFARNGGAGAYWAFVAVVALAVAAVCYLVGRRLGHVVDGLLVALGSLVLLHLVDLVTGAHLEWNAVFGYSATIGIRLVGQGNLAFAQLAAAAVLWAGLYTWRVAPPRGIRTALAVLAVTVVVMGAPWWGADFGSVLSAVPAFALMGWMLLGHRLTVRSALGIAGTAIAAVLLVGLADVLRPAQDRTHIGRFFVKLADDSGAAALVIRRKASGNLSVLGSSVLIATVVVAAGLLAYLWWGPGRPLRAVAARIPTARAMATGFLTVALLGFLLNDSGITIPGMMSAVLIAAVVWLTATMADDSS